MESSSSPVVAGVLIGAQRSNNTTPHHHNYYSSPTCPDQPSTFAYGDPSLLPGHGPSRRSSNPQIMLKAGGGGIPSPLHHLPPSSRATPRSRNQSPSVNSLGAESNILGIVVDQSPLATLGGPLHRHHHHLPHTPQGIVGHGHNHLHDDSQIHINCDNSSHSISPPNSNSNTTISCGSGNSTSANIGAPTSRDHRNTRGNRATPNHNNNNSTNRKNYNNKDSPEDYDNNYRNSRNNTNSRTGSKKKPKKSILEDDCLPEKLDNGLVTGSTQPHKFKQRPPFINPNQEFLPICDALFNMISLAAYFCDVVFDVLAVYTWYKMSLETDPDIFELAHLSQQQRNRLSSGEVEDRQSSMPRELMWQWSLLGFVFIMLSCCLSQALSFKWYKESTRRGQKAPDGTDLEGPPPPCSSGILVMMHVSLVGVLWRYFKLFIPVDLRFVKNEVRDLCLLRLIHAFCQAAPMLLLQLYLIWHEPGLDTVTDLTKVSTALSLFSVCWALASFSKHIRRQNVHKLVLTWLGVIFQFFWRLGTVTSRFLALSLYAMVYQYWVFVVLFLHWFCMLLWLISPKNIFHGEKMSPLRKVSYSAIVAVVYTFCYINVQETNSRVKVVIYYVTMFLENSLLLSVWLIAKRYEDEIWFRTGVTWAVFLCLVGGLFFMCLYYKYFHVKKLSYVYDAESSIYRNTSSIGGCSLMNDNGSMIATISGGVHYDTPNHHDGSRVSKNNGVILGGGSGSSVILSGNQKKSSSTAPQSNRSAGRKKTGDATSSGKNGHDSTKNSGGNSLFNKLNGHHIHHPNVPGVFNCRFHPAMKRKKKKPTTFVPPPAVASTNQSTTTPVTTSMIAAVARAVAPSPLIMTPPREEVVVTTQVVPQDNLRQSDHLVRSSPMILGATSTPNGIIPHHHHHPLDHHYDHCNTSSVQNNSSNQSMSPHYDLPEYESNHPGGSNGSASSSYGQVYHHSGIANKSSSSSGARIIAPFWRRPLSVTMGSENEGSVSSRVDIHQKLQEKKQQQLAELREIEEEIKKGILKRPELHEIIPQPVSGRQPIPVEKKQPWFDKEQEGNMEHTHLHQRPPMMLPGDPEILLDPHQYLIYASGSAGVQYVEGNPGFYYSPEWPPNYYEPLYQNGEDIGPEQVIDEEDNSAGVGEGEQTSPASGDNKKGGIGDRRRRQRKGYFDPSSRESIYKSYRIPSDIDSQMSLPRSYTLPREFKYKRKFRKPVKTENFLPSTNSSDGDVDSGEDAELYSQVRPYPLPLPSMHHIHHSHNHSAPAGVIIQNGSPCTSASINGASPGVLSTPPALTSTPTASSSAAATTAAAATATRHSRKIPNGRPRHKLHETKL